MKFINVYLVSCLLLKSICENIVNRRIYIDIDSDFKSGRIIEYIQYKFNFITQSYNSSIPILTHHLPSSKDCSISLISVRSNETDLNNSISNQLVNRTVNLFLNRTLIKERKSITFIYEYKISRITNNKSIYYDIPNFSESDLKSYIEIIIRKLYDEISPKVMIGNFNDKTTDIIELDKYTVFQSNISSRKGIIKDNKKSFILKFNLTLRRNNYTEIGLIMEKKSNISTKINKNNYDNPNSIESFKRKLRKLNYSLDFNIEGIELLLLILICFSSVFLIFWFYQNWSHIILNKIN